MVDPAFDAMDRRLKEAADGRFRVFGIRRSGQHAVINWLLRNCGRDSHVFLNSCTMEKSPIRTCGQAEINGTPTRKGHFLKETLEKYLQPNVHPFVLVSYEAGYPSALHGKGHLTNGFGNSDFDHEILITRRFVNWLPSFIRLMRLMNPWCPPAALEISHGVLFEIMRYKSHIISAAGSTHSVISYDQWFADEHYRRSWLAAFGLPEIDNSHGEVQKYGGGSSFSQCEVPAAELEIDTRWHTLKDDLFARHFLRLALEDGAFRSALAQFYPEDEDIMRGLLA